APDHRQERISPSNIPAHFEPVVINCSNERRTRSMTQPPCHAKRAPEGWCVLHYPSDPLGCNYRRNVDIHMETVDRHDPIMQQRLNCREQAIALIDLMMSVIGIFRHLLEFRLMSAKRSILLRVSIALAVLYLLGTVFGGIGLGEIALHPARRPIRESEERNAEAAAQRDSVEFRDSELVAEDGTFLRAWYMRPQQASGNAVILLHGVSDNRLGMYGYARWLLQNHYSVLLPDARHHGSSGGLTSYGINEANDIHR